jgi:hypothetical protein
MGLVQTNFIHDLRMFDFYGILMRGKSNNFALNYFFIGENVLRVFEFLLKFYYENLFLFKNFIKKLFSKKKLTSFK